LEKRSTTIFFAMVIDPRVGDVTGFFSISSYNNRQPGSQIVTYSVRDRAGNGATADDRDARLKASRYASGRI
jgi:hypothetical protein